MTIYPNPFSRTAIIQLAEVGDFELRICDTSGNVLRGQKVYRADKIYIHRDCLASGKYLLELRNSQGLKTINEIEIRDGEQRLLIVK